MKAYQQSAQEVMQTLNVTQAGLSEAEAQARLTRDGHNKLAEPKKISLFQRFVKQMSDPMILVLLAAAAISAVTSIIAGESLADVFIILFVVLLNATMGVVQESKAEAAIDALKEMTAATSKVLRDGKVHTLHSEELVKGDIILLEAGDSVPADARLIEAASLKVEESALTGESVPSQKECEAIEGDVSLGDRRNMLYMGTTVVYGRATAVICQTGMETEMGKIADALTQASDETTPLQRQLNSLSRTLTWLVLGISVFVFIIGVVRAGSISAGVVLDTFILAVSLAVAAIPEGLSAVVTIVLSIGVTKMSKRNAVIRRLTAVETLGCAQIICSDKTGTLTQNKMTVVEDNTADRPLLIRSMALCSDAEADDNGEVTGEPTEAALVSYAFKNDQPKNALKQAYPRVGEAPFDSMRKMMSTVHQTEKGFVQYTKGAPDEVLAHCTRLLTDSGEQPLTEAMRSRLMSQNKAYADKALRVLASAYRSYEAMPESCEPDALEKDMTFIGMVGMIDPVRPEAKAAVERCRDAGISVVMITGDHIDTAVAIANDLGILENSSQAILGAALDDLSDEELERKIDQYRVYARVQPEHKVRIVNAWKKRGMVTAMTGDGVNDAPSIKAADIGVGMGITGTDVTKNVADMILADDNFATIVSAVDEGRKIYANIRKAVQFLLSSNLSEVVGIFVATMLGFTLLKPTHILWINLITDSLPALALGMEPGEQDAMKQPPRSSKAGIFAGGVGTDTIYQGLLVAALTLTAYFVGHYMEAGKWEIVNSADGMTMAFLTLSMAEIFHSFNLRFQRRSAFTSARQNWYLWGSAVLALVLTTAVIYVPFLKTAFSFESISAAEYFAALGIAFCVIPIVELVKWVQRRRG